MSTNGHIPLNQRQTIRPQSHIAITKKAGETLSIAWNITNRTGQSYAGILRLSVPGQPALGWSGWEGPWDDGVSKTLKIVWPVVIGNGVGLAQNTLRVVLFVTRTVPGDAVPAGVHDITMTLTV